MQFFTPYRSFMWLFAIALGLSIAGLPANAAKSRAVVLAGGCFWCVESDFEKVPGVITAVSGFSGGDLADPSYKQVVNGGTGHLEAVQITYDPDRVTLDRLLFLFLRSIDPTDADGQFCDRGHSYSTAIFVSDPAERAIAEAAVAQAQSALGTRIMTPIRDAAPFFPADDYHQDFYKQTTTILTRFGPVSKAKAYKKYRDSCGRDAKVRAIWGDAAPFAGH